MKQRHYYVLFFFAVLFIVVVFGWRQGLNELIMGPLKVGFSPPKDQSKNKSDKEMDAGKPRPMGSIPPTKQIMAPLLKLGITCSAYRGENAKNTVIGATIFSKDDSPVAGANVKIAVPFGIFQGSGTNVALGKTTDNGSFQATWYHPDASHDTAAGSRVEIVVSASKVGYQLCSASCQVNLRRDRE